MKNFNAVTFIFRIVVLVIAMIIISCESRYVPRTVPDAIPPFITVRLIGEELNLTYHINGMAIDPVPPEVTPDLNPGKIYRAIVTARDTIGMFNLRVGMNSEFFEITDIAGHPGVVTTDVIGNYTVVDVTLPISPARTGALLAFTFLAKPMTPGILAPFLGMNIIATDFGEAGRSSNASGYTIPLAYFAE